MQLKSLVVNYNDLFILYHQYYAYKAKKYGIKNHVVVILDIPIESPVFGVGIRETHPSGNIGWGLNAFSNNKSTSTHTATSQSHSQLELSVTA